MGRFRYPNDEQAAVEFYAAWPVSGAPGAETWSKPVIVGTVVGRGPGLPHRRYGLCLEQEFRLLLAQRQLLAFAIEDWLGHSADKPETLEPHEGGILGLPKPKS